MGESAVGIGSPSTGLTAEVTTSAPTDTGQAALLVRTPGGFGGGGGGGGAATIADGADVAEGATTDAAVVTDTTGTVSGKLRGLVKWAFERMPAALGQTTMSASLPVVLASNQASIPVAATLGAETTKVIGTVNQGTSPWVTNDPGLPDTLGQKTMANSTGVVLASDQASIPVAATLAAETTKVIGTVNVAAAQSIAATQSGTWTVQPGNTANTTAWKVDGSAVTQPISVAAPTTIYNGKKTVTTAGTRVTLASSQAVRSVVIKALAANTGTIYVGDGSVASTTGLALLAGDSVSLDIANLATVNLDSSVNGEGVTYIGTN